MTSRALIPARSAAAELAPTELEEQAESRSTDQQPKQDEDHHADIETGRDEADAADAEALQQWAFKARIGAAIDEVDHQADAAAGDHEDQSRDDRLDVEDGDQEAVPQAAQQADGKRNQQDDDVRIAFMHAPGDGGTDHRDDRADGQIDTLGADHHRHAEGEHCRRHAAIDDVDEAAEQAPLDDTDREEVGRDDAVDDEDHRQRRQWPDGAVSEDGAQALAKGPCLCNGSGLMRAHPAAIV